MLTFYHSPQSRSFSILWLLEELGQPYEMNLVDIRAKDGAPADGHGRTSAAASVRA